MKPIVYIIDADYNICRDLKILLENASLNVYSFPCPGLACDTITQHSPDALIIDIAFANCNVTSFDAVSEIQLLTGTKIPVVFISSRSDLVARTRAMRSGADAFFCKPITERELLHTVLKLLEIPYQRGGIDPKHCSPEHNTQLHTRQYFFEQLDVAINHGTTGNISTALIDINIDNFYAIKEKFGRDSIDTLHQQIGAIIRTQISINDLLIHFSDSVYMILAAPRTEKEIIHLATSINKALENKRIIIENRNILVTFNFSVIQINQYLSSVPELLDKAEKACAEAHNKELSHFVYVRPESTCHNNPRLSN